MIKKHLSLVVGGAVTALLALVLVWLLFHFSGQYAETKESVVNMQARLQRLVGRPVYPSEENVRQLSEQNSQYEQYLAKLDAEMRSGQSKLPSVDRSRFSFLFEGALKRLTDRARRDKEGRKEVKLPPKFAFGFDHYYAGNLPASEDVPRLVIQLRDIAELCDVLYEAGVDEIVSVKRSVFEASVQVTSDSSSGWRSQERETPLPVESYTDPDRLFSKERFVLIYRAGDEAQQKVLQRLAAGSPFTVVLSEEVINDVRPAVVLPRMIEEADPSIRQAGAGGTASWFSAGTMQKPALVQRKEVLPRELRVVAGQETAQVRLEVDVYRFPELKVEEEGGAQP